MDSYNCCAFSVNSSNTLKILHVTIMEEFSKLEKQLSKVKRRVNVSANCVVWSGLSRV